MKKVVVAALKWSVSITNLNQRVANLSTLDSSNCEGFERATHATARFCYGKENELSIYLKIRL